MAHLSSFCLKLDLITEPMEQCTSPMEHDLDRHHAGVKQRYDRPRPVVSYSIWDGLGWLMAETVELAGPASLCNENLKG